MLGSVDVGPIRSFLPTMMPASPELNVSATLLVKLATCREITVFLPVSSRFLPALICISLEHAVIFKKSLLLHLLLQTCLITPVNNRSKRRKFSQYKIPTVCTCSNTWACPKPGNKEAESTLNHILLKKSAVLQENSRLLVIKTDFSAQNEGVKYLQLIPRWAGHVWCGCTTAHFERKIAEFSWH